MTVTASASVRAGGCCRPRPALCASRWPRSQAPVARPPRRTRSAVAVQQLDQLAVVGGSVALRRGGLSSRPGERGVGVDRREQRRDAVALQHPGPGVHEDRPRSTAGLVGRGQLGTVAPTKSVRKARLQVRAPRLVEGVQQGSQSSAAGEPNTLLDPVNVAGTPAAASAEASSCPRSFERTSTAMSLGQRGTRPLAGPAWSGAPEGLEQVGHDRHQVAADGRGPVAGSDGLRRCRRRAPGRPASHGVPGAPTRRARRAVATGGAVMPGPGRTPRNRAARPATTSGSER
jgi:hypothetical protein